MAHRIRIRRKHTSGRGRPLRRLGGCLLSPFIALWRLVAGLLWAIVSLTGRFVAVLIGLVLIVAGALVSLTIVGAVIGIPLAIFGLLLIIRGLS